MRTRISYFSGVVEAKACPQQQVFKKITSKKGGLFFQSLQNYAKICKNKTKQKETSSASPLMYNMQAACQYQLIPRHQYSLYPLPFVSQETHG